MKPLPPNVTTWRDIDPRDAVGLDLSVQLEIEAPLNEDGERCPWPWEPQQLVGAPLGQYHCPYCGAMCMAGLPHLDYGPSDQQMGQMITDEINADPEEVERLRQSREQARDGRTFVRGNEIIDRLAADPLLIEGDDSAEQVSNESDQPDSG